MAFPFVASPHVTVAAARAIDCVVIHTSEFPERLGAARACAAWFADPGSEVSAHYCVDADEVIQCVREEDIAWHARGGNRTSIGVELAGLAAQGARAWGDAYSVAVLDRAAALIADVCGRHGVPVRRIRAPGLRRGLRGIAGHVDVSEAFGRSDHLDPGTAFPWMRFLAAIRDI